MKMYLFPALQDLAWMLTFYIRFFLTYLPLLGVKGILGLHLLVRYHSTYNSSISLLFSISYWSFVTAFLQAPVIFLICSLSLYLFMHFHKTDVVACPLCVFRRLKVSL